MDTADHDEFLSGIYEIVLRTETSDVRFENFCRAIVQYAEGDSLILGTSSSWDLGRDAVGYGRAHGIYVCASLRDDVDAKAISDLERIQETTADITRIYFCSSHRLSEHAITRLQSTVSDVVDGKFPVVVMGTIQLSMAASQEKKAIDRNYGAEVRSALSVTQPDPHSAEAEGMRLALISSAADDSHQVRTLLYQSAILDSLTAGGRTAERIANELSAKLKLGHPLPAWVVLSHVNDLLAADKVRSDQGVFHITPLGDETRMLNERAAAERLLVGRNEIQAALEAALDTRFIPDEFTRVWDVFEERLAVSLHSRGMAIVQEVTSLLNSADEPNETYSLSFVDELATAVAKTVAKGMRAEIVHDAVKDLFADRTGPAALWLVRVCASFVAACALGLEETSAQAVRSLLARTTLVLDTDVVLSLFGEGEPEHVACETIAQAWRANRGQLLVAQPVLLEVAYHAHIAHQDFEQTRHFLPGTPEDRLRAVDNVFVRSFAELMSRGQMKIAGWRSYIENFRGSSPYDFEQIMGLLRTDYRIDQLPPRSAASDAFFRAVQVHLLDQAERSNPASMGKEVRDKVARDAELYVAFVEYLDARRNADAAAASLLVSGGRRLAGVERKFRKAGEDHIVISVASALLLVSMLPRFSLGLSAMKTFLFDERRPGFSSDLERTIVRMVKTSSERTMPWAKRGVLARAARKKLIQVADDMGERKDRTDREILSAALAPKNQANTIQILAQALDEVDVDTRHERRARDLAAQVVRLQDALEREKRRKR